MGDPSEKEALMKCPTCGGKSRFLAEPVGPFCSERCRMVDLGKWFGEDYRVSAPLTADAFDEYESMEGPELDHPES